MPYYYSKHMTRSQFIRLNWQTLIRRYNRTDAYHEPFPDFVTREIRDSAAADSGIDALRTAERYLLGIE